MPHTLGRDEERYEIRSKIGSGGVGAVYRAYDRSLKREVAIKRLLPQGEKPEEERYHAEEIVREAGLLSKLQHPNVVSVYDAGIDDDGGFVVMELIDGETLDQTLARGALTYGDFASVAEQALEGLIAAQSVDMLHRDLKPSNVMIRWLPSGRFQLKLLDFGLARVTQRPTLQTVRHGDSILGSIYFMAPEQFEREPLDGRTDLYSLGNLFYYMLTGGYPFDGESAASVMAKKLEDEVTPLAHLRPDLPAPVCEWVMTLMARLPDDRPASAAAALRGLSELLDLHPTAPRPAERQPEASRPVLQTPATAAVPPPARLQLQTTSHCFSPPGGAPKRSKAGPALLVGGVLTVVATAGALLLVDGRDRRSDATATPDTPSSPTLTDDAPPDPAPIAHGPETLIPFGAVWLYDDRDAPLSPGWKDLRFRAEGWSSGPAPLGYGDPVATETNFGSDADHKRISTLFRKRFTVLDPASIRRLTLRFRVDDGCVVYLNGSPAARFGMPDGPPEAHTEANRVANAQAEAQVNELDLPANLLQQGDNIFAVRVHQCAPDSSDLLWDAELIATR